LIFKDDTIKFAKIAGMIFIRYFIIFLWFTPSIILQAGSPPSIGKQKSKSASNTDTTSLIPAMISVIESGERTPQARCTLDSLIDVSNKIGFIPGVARGTMMIGVFYWENPDSALQYFRIARQYSKQQNYKLGYFLSTHNIGTIYLNYGIQDSAIFWLIRALGTWTPEIGMNRHAKIQLDLGTWYAAREDYKQGLNFLMPAMNSMKRSGDTVKLRSVYNELGILYTNLHNFEKARTYYEQIFIITPEQFMNGRFWADNYNNLGTLYMEVKKDYDSALYIFRKSLKTALKYKLTDKLLIIQLNMGSVFHMLHQQDSSTFYLRSAKARIDKFTPRIHMAGLFINYGVALLSSGKTDSAKYYADKGMALLDDAGAANMKIAGYELLFRVDSVRGNYLSALRNLQQTKELTKQLYNKEIMLKVAEKEFAYQMQQKNDENNYLKRENTLKEGIISNQRLILGFAIFIILMIAGILIFIVYNRKKLQLLNNTKDKFLSIISHDLRSPFNSLLGLLNELHSGYDEFTDDERISILRMLQTSSQNTYHLLENLLEWTRAQQGKISSVPEIIPVRTSIGKTIDLLRARAEKKGIEIRNEITPALTVYADPMLFDNCILNITNNAIKFTPSGGTITIHDHKNEKSVFVCCTDTGIGIPGDYLNQIFKLDGKVKRNGTANEPGTGLGLILCREFVDLMHGKITLESKVGEGTTVCIEIPARR